MAGTQVLGKALVICICLCSCRTLSGQTPDGRPLPSQLDTTWYESLFACIGCANSVQLISPLQQAHMRIQPAPWQQGKGALLHAGTAVPTGGQHRHSSPNLHIPAKQRSRSSEEALLLIGTALTAGSQSIGLESHRSKLSALCSPHIMRSMSARGALLPAGAALPARGAQPASPQHRGPPVASAEARAAAAAAAVRAGPAPVLGCHLPAAVQAARGQEPAGSLCAGRWGLAAPAVLPLLALQQTRLPAGQARGREAGCLWHFICAAGPAVPAIRRCADHGAA